MSKSTRSRKENPTTKPFQPKSQIRRRLSGSDLDDDDGIFMLKPTKPHSSKHASGSSLEVTEPGSSKNCKPPKKRSRSRSRTRSTSPSKCPDPLLETERVIKVEAEPLMEEDCQLQVPPDPESKDKVVCPFCWKKLSDKLSGMAHVKSCGKNLPTERIFDALQLQEKQVQEWAELGIAYPGFQNPAVNGPSTRGGKTVRGGGRNRKKKADPELELALALSESLHEEIENRRRTSDEYLIKIGLENEVTKTNHPAPLVLPLPPLPKPPSSFRVRFGNKGKPKLTKHQDLSATNDPGAGPTRTRKTKTKLTETRLFTVTDTEREMIICEKVGQILEESEKENADGEEKYKADDFELPLGISTGLEIYRDKTCKLWKMASSEISPRNSLHKLPTTAVHHQECEPMDRSTQTLKPKLVDQATQTDPQDLMDNSAQTDCRGLADGCAQTEPQTSVCESIQTEVEFVQIQNGEPLPEAEAQNQDDNCEWKNEGDDSVILLEESSTFSELKVKPAPRPRSFSRSPSLSFGSSSSPEKNSRSPSPPPTLQITVKSFSKTFDGSIGATTTTSQYSSYQSPKATVNVTSSRRDLRNEFSRSVHRASPRDYSTTEVEALKAQTSQMDDFDWGNDDSVFEQVPDHVLDTNLDPDCDLNSSSSPLFLSEAEEMADPDAPSQAPNYLVNSKVLKKKKETSMKGLESKGNHSKDRHRLSSSQPIGRATATPDRITGTFSPPSYDPSPYRADSDNIDWGNDTDIFNAIPDVIDTNMMIPEPDYNRRRSSSSPSLDRSPVNKRKPGKPKTSKEKTKTGAKIKLPKKLGVPGEVDDHKSKRFPRSSSLSQPQPLHAGASNIMTPPNTSQVSLTQGYNAAPDQTPMLNYSCIDTPILKAELKKYGLKPLPRSKAKKILRHIYTETHK